MRADFRAQFANPDFPHPFDKDRNQIHFLGVWDTVKSVGWLDFRGRLQMARWPFTARISNVGCARHAMAIDERRRFYEVYRFDPKLITANPGRFQEMWFAGVHSDVGGQFPDDHRLSDIAFSWITESAHQQELRVDNAHYRRLVGVDVGAALPTRDDLPAPAIHSNTWPWRLLGGWAPRTVLPSDTVHPSVVDLVAATRDSLHPYRPDLADRGAAGGTATPRHRRNGTELP